MAYRLAKSLDVAIAEIRSVWPSAVIGTIASAQHRAASPVSDHNPEDHDHNPATPEVVCAIDPMDGPGVDIDELVRRILNRPGGPHPDLAYIIRNGKIYHRRNGFKPATYTGKDKHTNHAHISVGTGSDGRRKPPFDDPDPWGIADNRASEDDDMARLVKDQAPDGGFYVLSDGVAYPAPDADSIGWQISGRYFNNGSPGPSPLAAMFGNPKATGSAPWVEVPTVSVAVFPKAPVAAAGAAVLVPHTHEAGKLGPAVPVED